MYLINLVLAQTSSCLLQEVVQGSVIQMVAGDQVMISVFSVLGTVCKGAVLTFVISLMASFWIRQQGSAGRAILNVWTRAQARSVWRCIHFSC